MRERLSWREWWRARRRQERPAPFKLEPLDPASARARYRTFLQAMANQGQEFVHCSEETPAEYQTRLLAPLQPFAGDEATATLLADLTTAYNRERYGGAQTPLPPYDRRQLSQLVKRLKRAHAKGD